MKAAMLREIGKPITIEDVATPAPAAGEVLIHVEACGVCHSDLHLADGDWDLLRPITKVPLILGHEVAGTVAALGEGVTELKVGDRVGVPWIYWTCGECEFCNEGREDAVPETENHGLHGGWRIRGIHGRSGDACRAAAGDLECRRSCAAVVRGADGL